MGIVFNSNGGKSNITNPACRRVISRHRVGKQLTRQNIQFLQSLGLKVNKQNLKNENSKSVKKINE